MSQHDQPTYDQQAPPQGYYQPSSPPKKKHTVRNVFLVLFGLFILMLGGCMALVGGAVSEVDKAIQEEAANDKPATVAEGAAFTHDGYEAEGGWKVAKERFAGTSIKGLSVTNSADEARSALLTFRFYDGNEVVGEVECTSNQMQSGEASRLDCISFDSKPVRSFDTIKVSDMF